MSMLAIIPARGGSKGIPGKNVIDINGNPLIAYTIAPALMVKQEGYLDDVIVSTDDKQIAEVSREYGASVPFMRPQEIAGDTSRSVDLMIHAYDFYKERGTLYDSIILLQPTSPLRTAEDIRKSINIFAESGAKSLISCYKEESIHEYGLYHREGDRAIAINKDHNLGMRRQDMPELYVRNGAIYIVKTDYMVSKRNVFDEKPAMYVMPKERSVNIDVMGDVELTRSFLSNS